MRILIKNGHIVDPASNIDSVADLYIENGIISDIGVNLDYHGADVDEVDATGKYVLPGLVDMHCHLRDPGFTYKEDIESGSRSAAKGGFTSIACMPNTNPVIDNVAVLEYIKSKAQTALVNIYPIGAITKGLRGEELAAIGAMKFAGAVAISDDGRPVENPAMMRHAMEYAKTFDIPVISHCEDLALCDGGSMNEGAVSTRLGLRGINRASEEVMVSREIIIAESTDSRVHIAHVSTRGSVEMVRRAKERGVKVTCETCPHYFTLTEEAVDGYNTNAKMNPPLRTADDVEAIIEGLRDGTIDAIATDHAPHGVDEKNCEFDKALNGIVGFETAFALGVTYLVKPGKLTLSQLVEKMCYNPSRILGLSKGTLEMNKKADVIIADLETEYEIDITKFESKSKNSPYHGWKVYGTPECVIVGGEFIIKEEIIL